LSAIAFGTALAPHVVMADPPDDIAARRRRMEADLEVEASNARATRITNTVTGVVTGLVLVPTGILLLARSNILGLGMTIGGGTQLALVPLALFPSGIERVDARFQALRDTGAADDLLRRATEQDWHATAVATRSVGRAVGWSLLGVGAAAASTGLGLLIVNPGNNGPQYTAGAICASAGLSFLVSAFRLVLQSSAEENSWLLHQRVESHDGWLQSVRLSASPTPGGLQLGATAAF
jgi:hypothetical protein